jgi:hypothetical protein
MLITIGRQFYKFWKRGGRNGRLFFLLTLPIKKAAFFITNFDRFTNYTMKYLLAIVSLTLLLFSCKNQDEEYHKPESALDAGREFIQQSLKGKFVLANKYMLQDEENQYWLTKWSQEYSKISEQEKAGYSKASIIINEVNDVVPDSVTIIRFSNSYKNRLQNLKVVKANRDWKVDFKYTFSGNL